MSVKELLVLWVEKYKNVPVMQSFAVESVVQIFIFVNEVWMTGLEVR